MLYLKSPQTTDVIAALKTDDLQALVKAGLDADKARAPCSNHGHTASHGRLINIVPPNFYLEPN